MRIISEGTPMTCGEVYALVRRRRDERNAAQHPPFCLQLQQADPQSRASSNYLASKFASSNSANQNNRIGSGTPLGGGDGRRINDAAAAAAATTALLMSPSSAHLVVLLTEVKLMSYLANHSHLCSGAAREDGDMEEEEVSASQTIKHTYGPTTVFPLPGSTPAMSSHSSSTTTTRANNSNNNNSASNGTVKEEEEEGHTDVRRDEAKGVLLAGGAVTYQFCLDALAATQPGTEGHVACVSLLLDAFERAGREREVALAHAVKRVLYELQPTHQYWASATASFCNSESTCGVGSKSTAGAGGGVKGESGASAEEKRSYGGASASAAAVKLRPLLAPPTNIHTSPVANGFLSFAPVTSSSSGSGNRNDDGGLAAAAVAHSDTIRQRQVHFLSDAEVMQLVVAQPRNAVDVCRLLDNLERRLGGDEEAVAWFADAVVRGLRSV